MRFLQDLRWQIVAANMLIALVAVVVLLVFSAAVFRGTFRLDTADPALAEGDYGQYDLETLELAADTLMPIVQRSFLDFGPIAIIAALGASLIASLFASQRIIFPVQEMASKSRRIANGLYVHRLSVEGDDELAQLAASFDQMAEALDQVTERRVALVGYLSHELRTPLSGVSGYIEGMMDGVFPDTDATLALMYGEVRRMRRLVDDLQSLSRVQAGQISLRMGTFELSSFVEQATVKLRPQWITSGIDLIVEQSGQTLVVYADPDRVDQVLLNLLSNSLANTPEGGKVTVEIVRDGKFARVNICDTGNGIPEEEIPFIFERYYRAQNTGDREDIGIGIGLTISRHLVLEMGGELSAQSEGPGKGSTFSFMLPISKSYVAQK